MSNLEPLVIQLFADDKTNAGFDSAERTMRKNKKTVSDIQKKYQFLRETVNKTAEEVDLYRMKLAGATAAEIKSIRKLQEKTAAMQRNTQAQKGMNGQLRLMRGGLGQVGHQIQDVVVQAQMGQNAFLILGQQGSQIASLFGQRGALYGALLAIGAAFATFIQSSLGGVSSLKKLEEQGESLAQLFGGKLFTETNKLADGIREVARESRELALFQIMLGKQDAFKQQADASKLLADKIHKVSSAVRVLGDDTGNMFVGIEAIQQKFGVTADEAKVFRHVVEDLSKGTKEARRNFVEFATHIMSTKDASTRTALAFTEVVRELESVTTESINATRRLTELDKAAAEIENMNMSSIMGDPKEVSKSLDIIANAMLSQGNEIEQVTGRYEKHKKTVIDAMNSVGKSHTETQAMGRRIDQQRDSEIREIHARRLNEFNQLMDTREKEEGKRQKIFENEQRDQERRREQIRKTSAGELDALGKINHKYDEKLLRVKNLTAEEPALFAQAAAEVVQIEAERTGEIERLQAREAKIRTDGAAKIAELMRNDETAFMASLQTKQAMLEQGLALNHITRVQFNEYEKQLQTDLADHTLNEQMKVVGGLKHVEDSFTTASHAFITGAQNGTEAIQSFGRAIVDELIKSLIQMGIEKVKQSIISKKIEASALASSVGTNAAAMSAIALQSAPAAAAVSLATAGGNAVPAINGLVATHGVSKSLAITGFEGGGFTGFGSRSGGMDGKGGFMAMLHPNETVTDHTQGGGGITIVNNITTEGGGDVDQKIAIAVTESSHATVSAVQDMLRRGRM